MRPLFQLIAQHAVNPERVEQLVAELRPETFLEDTFAAQIVRSTLRLDDENRTDADRALLTTVIRRAMSELRKLQTDRHLKTEFQLDLPGLISAKDVLRFRRHAAKQEKTEKRKNEPISDAPEPPAPIEASLDRRIRNEERKIMEDLKKRTQSAAESLSPADPAPKSTPRNAPCPCKSGEKYKRCCGKGAPPVYTQAA